MFATPRRSRTTVAVTAALVLALVAGGCSGDDDPEPGESPGSGSSATDAPVLETTAKIGQVAGTRLPDDRRAALLAEVQPIVDGWIDGAYVGGTWPRTDVGDAFTGFSAGARKDAERDLVVLSNTDVGDRITAVTATVRRLYLDVLAVKREAAAVTARVWLKFDIAGEAAGSETVKARLFLTRAGDDWEVFGYDVSAGDGAVSNGQQKGTR
jgi:hypothetical protein